MGKCVSCYECLDDGDVREGSCRQICGHSPRPVVRGVTQGELEGRGLLSMGSGAKREPRRGPAGMAWRHSTCRLPVLPPETGRVLTLSKHTCLPALLHLCSPQLPGVFGLPYDPDDEAASEWVIDAAVEVAALFKSTLGTAPAVGWFDLGTVLGGVGFDFLPPEQLRFAVLQVTRANATYSGYVAAKSPRAPPPNAPPDPPPAPPSPPRSGNTSVNATVNGTSGGVNGTSGGGLNATGAVSRHRAELRRRFLQSTTGGNATATTTSLPSFPPTMDANPSTAPVYPEDLVRVFLLQRRDHYDAFCPPDAQIFSTGLSYPGCACMAIPPEYQSDTSLVTGSTKQWIDYLALLGGANATTAQAACPQGFRCSSANFQHMRHLMSRAYIPLTMGICVPCLVGEYCPEGTVEKTQDLVEVCNRRSALLDSAEDSSSNSSSSSSSSGSGSSNSNKDCGNTRLCPAGSYCPAPSVKQNCTVGDFCTEGSTGGCQVQGRGRGQGRGQEPGGGHWAVSRCWICQGLQRRLVEGLNGGGGG